MRERLREIIHPTCAELGGRLGEGAFGCHRAVANMLSMGLDVLM